MADVVQSTAETAGFIPQYWARRALDVLRQQIVLPQVVARDTDFGEVGWEGKSITVPYPGTFTAQKKVEGTPVTPQAPVGGSSVTLTLDQHRIVGILVEDFANALATGSLMDRFITPGTIALAEQFQADLIQTAAAAGTIAAIGTAGTDLTASVLRSAMTKLDTAKAPLQDRSVMMASKDRAALIGDSTLQYYFANAQPDAIRNGYFGEIYGLDLFWTQQVPTAYTLTGGTTSTFTWGGQTTGSQTMSSLTAAALQTALAGLSSVGAAGVSVSVSGPTGGPFVVTFSSAGALTVASGTTTVATATLDMALHKNAVMFAMRQFPPTNAAGVASAQVSDPESGLTIRISSQYDINNVGQRVNLDLLYGMKVLRADQLVPILT